MLNESKSVIEATRRVSGKSTFDDQEVKSTIGATRKTSPMDRVLDFILGIFSKKSANISREEQRIAALKIASEAAPVRAEKPQAPIQYERNEVDLGPDANYVDDFNEQSDQNSKSKDSPQTQEAKDYSSFIPSNNVVKASQSLESMAMLPSSNPSNFNQPSQNQSAVCRSCGYPVKPGDRFCDNCGLEL